MPKYERAGEAVYTMLGHVIKDWHEPIDKACARACILFVFADRDEKTGTPKGPALTHNGWPCQATIKITSQKDRAAGLADFLISIDADNWQELTETQQVALLDHEMEHLVLITDGKGEPRLDASDRPKLKGKPHDWELGGFKVIAGRHGADAPEVRMARQVCGHYGQFIFDWAQDDKLTENEKAA